MSLFDGLTPTYTFRLQIERSDRTILDTAITTKATADEITKVKRSVRRLLDEYAPTIKTATAVTLQPGTVLELDPENQAPIDPTDLLEPEAQPDKPEEAPAPAGGGHTSDEQPEGAKGLLRLYCRECGNTFGTFLKERRSEITCRCGHHIDLTVPLALYRFTCPYCQHEGWGKTNSEDPEIEVQCKCREMITVRWNPDAREYQN